MGLLLVTDRGPAAELLLGDLVECVAARVAELLADRLASTSSDASPWLDVNEAAEYMRCKPKRIYDLVSQHRLAAHRDGARVLFRREELDAYLLDAPAESPSARRSRTPVATGNSGLVSARSQHRGELQNR
jgi:excisionase family DNA binding protein